MSDRWWVVAGAVLAVGGLLASVAATRPRPRSVLEFFYLALPLAGAVVLAALAWGRT